jgi:hypothetical protein
MTSGPNNFEGFPFAPPGELCGECLGLILAYLKLLPKPQSLFVLVDLMKMAQDMKHRDFHPMILQLFIEAKRGFSGSILGGNRV